MRCTTGGRQSGAVLYSAMGVMGKADSGERDGRVKSNGSSGSQTGSGYSTDASDEHLPPDPASPASDPNANSDSDEQVCAPVYACGGVRILMLLLKIYFLIFMYLSVWML